MSKHRVRLYLDEHLNENKTIFCDKKQSHYLANVMRLRDEDTIHLFNGRQGEWGASFHHVKKNECCLKVANQIKPQTPPSREVTLLFAPLKHTRQLLIDEKCTELGVTVFQPIRTDHTTVGHLNIDKMKLHTIEAAEQSGRMDVPVIQNIDSLKAVILRHDKNTPIVFCDERKGALSLFNQLPNIASQAMSILIGPEGGFSEQEFDFLDNIPYVHPVSLGPYILRAETAAILSVGTCMQV